MVLDYWTAESLGAEAEVWADIRLANEHRSGAPVDLLVQSYPPKVPALRHTLVSHALYVHGVLAS